MTVLSLITHFLAASIGGALGFMLFAFVAVGKDADECECTDYDGRS